MSASIKCGSTRSAAASSLVYGEKTVHYIHRFEQCLLWTPQPAGLEEAKTSKKLWSGPKIRNGMKRRETCRSSLAEAWKRVFRHGLGEALHLGKPKNIPKRSERFGDESFDFLGC